MSNEGGIPIFLRLSLQKTQRAKTSLIILSILWDENEKDNTKRRFPGIRATCQCTGQQTKYCIYFRGPVAIDGSGMLWFQPGHNSKYRPPGTGRHPVYRCY